MAAIGILAYGSLIEDPGAELTPLIVERRTGVETPFAIEIARSSSSRFGAPTVIPVDTGGAFVKATILLLHKSVSYHEAESLLWRRETRNEGSGKQYKRPDEIAPNKLVVECVDNFRGVDRVIYTRLGCNISDLTSQKLAELAIASAKAEAGRNGKDGISYLLSLKRQEITTPLMPSYESEIMKQLNVTSLEEALEKCRLVQSS